MEDKTFDRVSILLITVFMEAGLLLIASIWIQAAQIDLLPSLSLDFAPFLIGLASGLALAVSSLLIFWLARYVRVLADLKSIIYEQVAPIFSNISASDALVIAAVSGFCEEVFFRGILQNEFGIVVASIIFGFCHCPSLKHISYGIWAVAAGFFLGGLYKLTGNLWTPVVAHGVSNCISLLILRYAIKPPPDDSQRSDSYRDNNNSN